MSEISPFGAFQASEPSDSTANPFGKHEESAIAAKWTKWTVVPRARSGSCRPVDGRGEGRRRTLELCARSNEDPAKKRKAGRSGSPEPPGTPGTVRSVGTAAVTG
ncbi:predicted protein [Streptomyces sp. AA4]|nr:predicted protein [Streptomyces sp. AA4]